MAAASSKQIYGVEPCRVGDQKNEESYYVTVTKKLNEVRSLDRSVSYAFEDICKIKKKIKLPENVIDEAKKMFKQIHDGKKDSKAKAAACLYVACRQENVFYTFKEISKITNINVKKLSRSYKSIVGIVSTTVTSADPVKFMPRFYTKLDLPDIVQRTATLIARRAIDMEIVTGRTPIVVAAAAIFMASKACELKLSKVTVIDNVGCSYPSFQATYNILDQHADQLIYLKTEEEETKPTNEEEE